MYHLYVDECGDPGPFTGQNTPHFILVGLILNSSEWSNSIQRLMKLRKHFRKVAGLPEREEIHSSELIRVNKLISYRAIPKAVRITLLKNFVQELPAIFPDGKIICICFDKQAHPDIKSFQEIAWNRLINRYDTFLKKNKGFGTIIADESDEPGLRKLLRKMRVYNPVKSMYSGYYNPVITYVVEDIFFRQSKHSLIIQAVDAIAHSLYRKEYPKGSLRKYNLEFLFNSLSSMCLKEASLRDPHGVVRQ